MNAIISNIEDKVVLLLLMIWGAEMAIIALLLSIKGGKDK